MPMDPTSRTKRTLEEKRRLQQCQDRIANVIEDLINKEGHVPLDVLDAVMAVGINSAIDYAGHAPTARFLAGWMLWVSKHVTTDETRGSVEAPRH